MSLPAIILAAGESRRLGQAKQLIEVAGEALLARTLRVVRDSGAHPIFVVLGARQAEVKASVSFADAELVFNPAWEEGIASSIKAGLQASLDRAPEADGVLLIVCDQPRLSVTHLREMMVHFESTNATTAVASEYAAVVGVPAIFPASRFAELMALQGDSGARAILQQREFPLVALPFEGGEMDIDTPADLAGLQSTLNRTD